jgi:tyrosinase
MNDLILGDRWGRRAFIRSIGWGSAGLLLSTMGGCEDLIEQIKNRPVRRRLRMGSAEVDADINTYKQAVTLMTGLPASDPRSWAAQAGIHGTVSGGFNFCQHGTDHFFSWHRAYLFYFERICQKLTGQPKFGLPYWNWNQDPAMHPAFTAAGSPLLHGRNRTSLAGFNAFSTPTLDPIFGDGNFFTFSSQIEGTPHNSAHSFIGQDMVTGGSPLDPIFWAHHCMIDYCWAKWNFELENQNTNDATWNGTSWNHFVDENGNPASATAGGTTLMPLLSYRYESSAIGSSAAAASMAITKADFKKLEKRIKEGADVKFEIKRRVPIANRASMSMAKVFSSATNVPAAEFSALIKSDSAKERIFASVAYAKLPPTNDFYVRVFVNLPDASPSTSMDDPHYAGSFAFFGTDAGNSPEHAGHQGRRFLVNLTPTLQKLTRAGQLQEGATITLHLVPVPIGDQFIRADAELHLENIELIVTPVIVKGQKMS